MFGILVANGEIGKGTILDVKSLSNYVAISSEIKNEMSSHTLTTKPASFDFPYTSRCICTLCIFIQIHIYNPNLVSDSLLLFTMRKRIWISLDTNAWCWRDATLRWLMDRKSCFRFFPQGRWVGGFFLCVKHANVRPSSPGLTRQTMSIDAMREAT